MKIIRIPIFLFIIFLYNQGNAKNYMTIYDFSFEDIDGNIVNLEKFIGNPILIVNTASRCGFTPQYENLQNLFIEYRKTDLTIIAITSNSFNQEYSSNEEIKKICLVNYDVGFITSSPLKIKGDNKHKIFEWLQVDYNETPKWNFYKYLFDREGKLVDSWSSITKPDSNKIKIKINKLI